MNKLKCNNIEYRKGYIEIIPNIHKGFINLETWDIHPDYDLEKVDISDDSVPDDFISGNTEIELSIEEAKKLILMLESAINSIKDS